MQSRWPAAAAAVLTLAATPGSAPAQQPRLVVGGGVALAEHRVDVGYGVERSAGTVFDGGARVEVGAHVAFTVIAQTGVLHPGTGATLPRELAEAGLDASYRARSWLDMEGGLRVRSYTTAVGRQRWTVPHLGVAARVPFALAGLRGVVGVAAHPFAAVSGLPDPEVAVSSRAGMQYTRGRLEVELVYSLDRYDFAKGTMAQRLEQYSALALRLNASGWLRP